MPKNTEIETVNITDKISNRDAEMISEMVTDALVDMGMELGEDFSFSWNLEVDIVKPSSRLINALKEMK
jgi:hypothetical protein